MKAGFPAQHTVDMNGRFFDGTHPELDGRYVKECDDCHRSPCQSSALYREHQYVHDYPHCWRTDHPLFVLCNGAAWFVRMTAVRDSIMKHNDSVEWAPPSTGTGRMG